METLDSLGIGAYVLDENESAALWNKTFLNIFPEHDGHIYVGEPYRDNLRRFYRARLDSSEQEHIETYIIHGINRHRNQFKPFEFLHDGQWLRVASMAVPGCGQMRIWTRIAPPALDSETLANNMARHGKAPALSLIDDIADGLMVRDFKGEILFANRRFCKMYGLKSEAESVGKSLAWIVRQCWDGAPGSETAVALLADNLQFAGAPFVLALPDDRWIRVSEHRAPDDSGISTHTDITDLHRMQRKTVEAQSNAEALAASLRQLIDERDQAESAMRQAQRVEAVGQLTSGLAHDFNNLLSVMLANLERLDAHEADPIRRHRLSVIRGAVDRGAALTDKLLAFARRQPLQPSAVGLAELIADMLPLLRSACGGGIVVNVDVADSVPAALVDTGQLELVILNLAINARDAMPDGGTLTITAWQSTLAASPDPEAPASGDYVVLDVTDTGTGMSEAVQARAVEPFFTTKPPGSGSGLGLSQAYGLARQSGGTVQIESTLGKGTSVRVLLPVSALPAIASPRPPPPVADDAQVRVLLVDDEPSVLDVMAELLDSMGYVVTSLPGGRAAMQALEDGLEVDILVTDVRMPDISGPDLARWLLERKPGFPVMFISGFSDPKLLDSFGDNCQLLRKPSRSKEIQAAISALLQRGREVATAG